MESGSGLIYVKVLAKKYKGVQENDEKDLGEIDKNVSERVKVEKVSSSPANLAYHVQSGRIFSSTTDSIDTTHGFI